MRTRYNAHRPHPMSILSLIKDAILTEIRNRFAPSVDPFVVPDPAPPESPWMSPQFHIVQLAAERCLCGAAKDVGYYHCSSCRPETCLKRAPR